MAKSYMLSRPPWRPLSLSNIEFRTPPPIGTNHYMDEESHSVACYSLPSTKVLLNRFNLSCSLLPGKNWIIYFQWLLLSYYGLSSLTLFQLRYMKSVFSLAVPIKKRISLAADNLCCFNFVLDIIAHLLWKMYSFKKRMTFACDRALQSSKCRKTSGNGTCFKLGYPKWHMGWWGKGQFR